MNQQSIGVLKSKMRQEQMEKQRIQMAIAHLTKTPFSSQEPKVSKLDKSIIHASLKLVWMELLN